MTKSSTTLCRQPWSRRRLGGRKIEKEAASVTKGLLSVSGGLWSRLGLSAVETVRVFERDWSPIRSRGETWKKTIRYGSVSEIRNRSREEDL